MMTSRKAIVCSLGILFLSSLVFATSNGAWLAKVPARDREKVNPYHDQPDAVAAGRRVFVDHCAQCHGKDAQGTDKRPSLRTARVQQEATEGELHWLLVHGSMGNGMPSWSKLGDPQIWQVITYVRSLGEQEAPPRSEAAK
ncbi:MAG TPA: c-type cytochrome [Terriglobales bacterium]|jgi:mono/diheme cytochrome c family protein|nr:c-type cytochrome [Terriglobales bacterium]